MNYDYLRGWRLSSLKSFLLRLWGFRKMETHNLPVPTWWLSKLEGRYPYSWVCNDFIACRSYVFELWVEKNRILEQLDMAQCIASFLHLVFVFDLKFPKVCFNSNYSIFSSNDPLRLFPLSQRLLFCVCLNRFFRQISKIKEIFIKFVIWGLV